MTLVWDKDKTHVVIKCKCGVKGYKWRPELNLGDKIIKIWQSHHTCS